MKLCDECKETMKKAHSCFIDIRKVDEKTGRERRVVRIPVDLCETCLTDACKHLGHLVYKGAISG